MQQMTSVEAVTNNNGIVLIATGHVYYAKCVANLLNTIKGYNVLVYCDAVTLPIISQLGVQYELIQARTFADVVRIRLDLYNRSPFDKTIAIDVDVAWGKKNTPQTIFDLLDKHELIASNEGYFDTVTGDTSSIGKELAWLDKRIVAKGYGIEGKYWMIRGEFIAFKKSERIKQLYENALNLWSNPAVKLPHKFMGIDSEEIALSVAVSLSGLEPHKVGFEPFYWHLRGTRMLPTLQQLNNDYFGLSIGGNANIPQVYKLYDQLTRGAYKLRSKRGVIPEREQC